MVDQARYTVIHCGRLIDGTAKEPKSGVSLLLEDDRIKEVLPSHDSPVPPDAHTIDASDRTVLPGLMDIHVHLCSVVDPDEPHSLLSLMGSPSPLLALHAAKNARLMLEAGFTTVRDLAGYFNWRNHEGVSLRRAITMGLVQGPRVYAAGWVSQTSGHLDLGPPTSWYRDRYDRADGPWEVRKLTRELIRGGVDLIKTSATGGGGGHGEEIWWRNYTVEELAAIADEAHAVGKKVAVHSHTADGARNAVAAGCDTLEHGSGLDDDSVRRMADAGTFLVPTLSVRSERSLKGRQKGGANEHILRKQRESAAAAGGSLLLAYQAGVRIATGSDTYRALREYWGENAYELELMVQYGMSPADAIQSSTRIAAEAIGIANDVGTLEAGKWADMIVFNGDPLADISLLQDKARIEKVIKGGEVVVDRTAEAGA